MALLLATPTAYKIISGWNSKYQVFKSFDIISLTYLLFKLLTNLLAVGVANNKAI